MNNEDNKNVSNALKLNALQINTLKEIRNERYTYVESKCFCGESSPNMDITLCEYDRYGMPARNVICKSCGVIRLNPHLSYSSLVDFYKKHYRNLYTGKIASEQVKDVFKSQLVTGNKYYEYIKNEVPEISNFKNVLEIGCSSGGILKVFQDKGHKVTGVDQDEKYADYGRSLGVEILNGDITKIEENRKFDLIILSHVLEHFTDIEKDLKSILSLLKNNGLLFIAVPGLKNKTYYVGNRANFHYWSQGVHIWWFSKDTLINLLVKFQINIISVNEQIMFLGAKSIKKHNYKFQNSFNSNYKFIKIIYKLKYLNEIKQKLRLNKLNFFLRKIKY